MNIDIGKFEEIISIGMTANNTKTIMNVLKSCEINRNECEVQAIAVVIEKIAEEIKTKIKYLENDSMYSAFCMNERVEAYKNVLKIISNLSA